jgi:hypothetical protein
MRLLKINTLLVLFMLCMLSLAACATRPEIVADPPQHVHQAPEAVPWEEEYARARPKPDVFDESADIHSGEPFNGEIEREDEKGGTLETIADIIAFPFRGIGWLFGQVL